MKRDPAQKAIAKLLMLEWKMIIIRFGSQAGSNFMRIYAKLGMEKALEYKHMLEESEKEQETLKNLIQITSEKLSQYFGGENEKYIN